ncbi:MAG: DNA-3-methyladenine glycosylase 2 [Thauera sp.]|nr:DNA-3-methyladenine glycosylase 2 [Thauera sp.]
MRSRLFLPVALPDPYRTEDILAFHRRDPAAVAEDVRDDSLRKGLVLADQPCCLTITFRDGLAEATLDADGELPPDASHAFCAMTLRALGLTQDIALFERQFHDHPQLGRLIASQRGLRVPVTPTPFEALTWAVTGQQISVRAALSLRRRLILQAGRRHTCGLLCYPDAADLLGLDEATLREAGFSGAKARTLRTVAARVADGSLPLDVWTTDIDPQRIRDTLLAIPGIGPWTINYTLLRGYAWLDGSLHGDAAVRRGVQIMLDQPDKVGSAQAEEWLSQFTPWRALVGAHLWALQAGAG